MKLASVFLMIVSELTKKRKFRYPFFIEIENQPCHDKRLTAASCHVEQQVCIGISLSGEKSLLK